MKLIIIIMLLLMVLSFLLYLSWGKVSELISNVYDNQYYRINGIIMTLAFPFLLFIWIYTAKKFLVKNKIHTTFKGFPIQAFMTLILIEPIANFISIFTNKEEFKEYSVKNGKNRDRLIVVRGIEIHISKREGV